MMVYQMWQVKAGNLAEFVAEESALGHEPTTIEDWQMLLEKMYDRGLAEMVGAKMAVK